MGDLRQGYQEQIHKQLVRFSSNGKGGFQYPNFSDGESKASREIAWGIVERLNITDNRDPVSDQAIGAMFETITASFIEEAFQLLRHLRPGNWFCSTHYSISRFDQHERRDNLDPFQKSVEDSLLASALSEAYIIRPDIVIGRQLVTDEEINRYGEVVDSGSEAANMTTLRAENADSPRPILHAGISCKWTIRSDLIQGPPSEALNLISSSLGRLPHIAVVTAEPLPTRLAAIALGTGDVDCVYHFALPEMRAAIEEIDNEDQKDMLNTLIQGKRLRDISDLPFDLAA